METTSWKEFLVPYVNGIAHSSFMNGILEDMKNGIKFQPPLKNWFDEFTKKDLSKIKLVVVTEDYQELPINLDDETFQLVISRTKKDDGKEGHRKHWLNFNELFAEFLKEQKIHVPFVFIGPSTFHLAIVLAVQSKRFYLPDLSSDFWKKNLHKEVEKNVNIILKANEKSEINW